MEIASDSSIKIETSTTEIPELPPHPKEILKGSGGISLKGDSESSFAVVSAFSSKVFKKMMQGNHNKFI